MSGYDPEFLGEEFRIDIPWIDYDVFADVLKRDDLRENYIADYLHYSLVMSSKNRQAYLSACNLDQSQYRSVEGRNWFIDNRIGAENQLDNRYYKGDNPLDRGHLTRRTAVTWGSNDYIARRASNDSCSYANACLQHKNFNEDEWRIPEKIAKRFERDLNGRLSIMTGPLFTDLDRWLVPKDFPDVQPGRVPSGFWKILYYIDKKKSQAADRNVLGCEAYLVYQDKQAMKDKKGADDLDVDTLQVTITELVDLTGIQFPKPLYDANPLWYYARDDRDITEPERYAIKVAEKSDGVKEDWEGHVIHEREDIRKHAFRRVSA